MVTWIDQNEKYLDKRCLYYLTKNVKKCITNTHTYTHTHTHTCTHTHTHTYIYIYNLS